ncbi:MAG: hypothetical protein EBU90_01140 [Proteobacteria bacterium]|nr:hypothetical protein [Pseudomonadota bacterium]NBP13024.1 hypothetical protein [bacterium]
MKKLAILFATVFLFSGCTIYTEKQTEAVSQSVYATKDSIDLARIDLAESYINETTKLINPPKKRIEINAIYQKPIQVNDSKQRIVIVPEKYKSDKVVVVNTTEYDNLLKDKEIAKQLQKDNEVLAKAKSEFDAERTKQQEMRDKMVKDLNIMQKKLVEKDLAILWRNIIIVVLLALIGGYIYLRMNSGFKLF